MRLKKWYEINHKKYKIKTLKTQGKKTAIKTRKIAKRTLKYTDIFRFQKLDLNKKYFNSI